jgi:hypothetical protein
MQVRGVLLEKVVNSKDRHKLRSLLEKELLSVAKHRKVVKLRLRDMQEKDHL